MKRIHAVLQQVQPNDVAPAPAKRANTNTTFDDDAMDLQPTSECHDFSVCSMHVDCSADQQPSRDAAIRPTVQPCVVGDDAIVSWYLD